MTAPAPPPDPRIPRDQLVRRVLTAAGLSEAVTFGFIEAKAARRRSPPAASRRRWSRVANPLSAKFDTLRPSLLPGLVDAVAHNRRHGRRDVRLFEIGDALPADGETRARRRWHGPARPRRCTGPAAAREVDFFDVKGVVELLCEALGVAAALRAGATSRFWCRARRRPSLRRRRAGRRRRSARSGGRRRARRCRARTASSSPS